ncbi:MAG: hypothetical protein U0744_21330 [Gemmataceae bacterium]
MVLRAVKVVRQGFVKDVIAQADLVAMLSKASSGAQRKDPVGHRRESEEHQEFKGSRPRRCSLDARKHLGKREDLANGKDITFSLHSMPQARQAHGLHRSRTLTG